MCALLDVMVRRCGRRAFRRRLCRATGIARRSRRQGVCFCTGRRQHRRPVPRRSGMRERLSHSRCARRHCFVPALVLSAHIACRQVEFDLDARRHRCVASLPGSLSSSFAAQLSDAVIAARVWHQLSLWRAHRCVWRRQRQHQSPRAQGRQSAHRRVRRRRGALRLAQRNHARRCVRGRRWRRWRRVLTALAQACPR